MQIQDIRPKLIICQENNLAKIIKALKALGLFEKTSIIVKGIDNGRLMDMDSNIYCFEKLMVEADNLDDIPTNAVNGSPARIRIIFWSSGTTGRPKGIHMKHCQHNFHNHFQCLFRDLSW